MKIIASLLAASGAASAAISISLPGTTESDNWRDLTSANFSAAGYPSAHPLATNAWPGPVNGANSVAQFNKVGGGGYFASSSVYNAGTPGTFTVSDSSPQSSLKTIVLQLDLGGAVAGQPLLSYNGGSQSLVANFYHATNGDYLSGFGGPPSPTTNNVYQWDLSGVGNVTDYSIRWTDTPHNTIYALDLDTSDSFVQVVPEPSNTLLAGLGLLTLAARRRR